MSKAATSGKYFCVLIIYSVRKVVTTFESAREVVKGVIGQHWRGFYLEERALEYLCAWEKMIRLTLL